MAVEQDPRTGELEAVDAVEKQHEANRKKAAAKPTSTAENQEPESKNKNFVQAYPKGFANLRQLIDENQAAAQIYLFLVENLGSYGVVLTTQDVIANSTNYSRRTVIRAVKVLEEKGLIVTIPVGPARAYAIDPDAFWNSYDDRKKYAAFSTRTLGDVNGEIRKRLRFLAAGSKNVLREARSMTAHSQQDDLFDRPDDPFNQAAE